MDTDYESLMSRDEALDYVTKSLGIVNTEALLKDDPLRFLNELGKFQEIVPLQSFTLQSVPLGSRRRPAWSTVKENIYAGIGGLCYELNLFVHVLLRALRYDIYLAKSSVSQPNNHVVSIVRNVSKRGDLFLVDAGCGYPTFQAVDLSFVQESPEYTNSFLRYKFVKYPDGRIVRMHASAGRRKLPESDENNEWTPYYTFQLKPCTISEINSCFDEVFENPKATRSHYILRCTMFPGRRACALRNNKILRENDSHDLIADIYDTDTELVAAIFEAFPSFRTVPTIVSNAVTNWKNFKISERLHVNNNGD